MVLLTVAQVGFLVTGSVGTGILLRKKPADGIWSHPSACGLVGCGYGLLAGASYKHMIVFIEGNHGLDAVTSETGLQVGAQAEASLGPFGRTLALDFNVSNRGAGISHAVAFSKGAFVGVSAQGAVVGARLAANRKFYGVDVTPRQILMDDHAVTFPREWRCLMDEVYAKLILTSHYGEEEGEEEVVVEAQPYFLIPPRMWPHRSKMRLVDILFLINGLPFELHSPSISPCVSLAWYTPETQLLQVWYDAL